MNSSQKRLLIVAGMVIAVVLALYAGLVISRLGKFKLEVVAAPHDSILTMDGQPLKEGVIYIAKGAHTFTAERQYFEKVIKKVDTVDLEKGQKLYLMPSASSEDAIKWLQEHPEVQQEREAAAGAEQEQIAAKFLKRYPILSKLPAENLHYKIDYSISNDQKVKLLITTYGVINGPADYPNYLRQTKEYRQEALNFINENGAKPSDFTIEYIPKID